MPRACHQFNYPQPLLAKEGLVQLMTHPKQAKITYDTVKMFSYLKNQDKSKDGFTLLEVLVVITIAGLISTLLMQGFAYVVHLRSQFLIQLDDLQRGTLQEHWFRSTTAALTPDYNNGKHIFKGDSEQFSGLTLAPLNATTGTPVAFTWRLESKEGFTILSYQDETDNTIEVMRWLGEEGEFTYWSATGESSSAWPPLFGLEPPQLPQLIQLNAKRRHTPLLWLVKLTDRNYTRYDPRIED